MIAYLKGNIIESNGSEVIIVVNDVGYKVLVPTNILMEGNVELYTYMSVSQDNIRLIGFDSKEKLNIFQNLISINGIGPKAALNILSSLSAEEIGSAIQNKDPNVFTKVSGIGKKNAERIILELAGKLQFIEESKKSINYKDQLEVALKGLGYSTDEIKYASENINKDIELEERVKESLRLLNRR